MSSDEFKIKFFGDKMHMCEYQPYIKISQKNLHKMYCTMKFRHNSANENTTKLIQVKHNKKIQKTIRSFHDLYYELKSLSKIKLIIEHGRVWFKKYIIGGENKIIYGVNLTILAIKYETNK